MDRRTFLKTLLGTLAGLTVLRWLSQLNQTSNHQGQQEARFYKRADHLAG